MQRLSTLHKELFKECQKIVYYKWSDDDIQAIKQRLMPLVRRIELEQLRRDGIRVPEENQKEQ